MAYDELQRDPPKLLTDFIEHTGEACWDRQFYLEWCPNHSIEPDPIVRNFANMLTAFRTYLKVAPAWDSIQSELLQVIFPDVAMHLDIAQERLRRATE